MASDGRETRQAGTYVGRAELLIDGGARGEFDVRFRSFVEVHVVTAGGTQDEAEGLKSWEGQILNPLDHDIADDVSRSDDVRLRVQGNVGRISLNGNVIPGSGEPPFHPGYWVAAEAATQLKSKAIMPGQLTDDGGERIPDGVSHAVDGRADTTICGKAVQELERFKDVLFAPAIAVLQCRNCEAAIAVQRAEQANGE